MRPVMFWLSAAIVVYIYFGYPLSLMALIKLRPALPLRKTKITPTVSIIIAAYNEENTIAAKLDNTLALQYPPGRLQVVVASDGSTDRTNSILDGYNAKGMKAVILEANCGKSTAQNAAAAQAIGEILFFTDANAMLRGDAILQVVANLADPQVGCVVGQVTYVNRGDTSVSEGEGAYWRYELFLRRKESELGNLAIGSGPIMAIRRSLFRGIDPDVGEDFVLPVQAKLSGYRVVYEPSAISEEILFQNRPSSMYKSKVRIVSKDFLGLLSCRDILNPILNPLCAWGLVSHKLLRWLVPYFLLLLFFANLLLLDQSFYRLIMVGQVAFYSLALAGYVWQRVRKPPRMFGIPFSFCLVNAAALIGTLKLVTGGKSGRWQPVRWTP